LDGHASKLLAAIAFLLAIAHTATWRNRRDGSRSGRARRLRIVNGDIPDGPIVRPRRLRRTAALRELVADVHIHVDDLVAPLFVREGIEHPQPIASLPGVVQHTCASLRDEVGELVDLGVKAVILFGVPEKKDAVGSGAFDPDGIVQVALRELRAEYGDSVVLMADLCVDEYTDHGHCGIVDDHGVVDNDATLAVYAQAAVAQAEAGAHVVAPSGMMDGQVAVIRSALDEAGFRDVSILAYSAKYASALYGPFRDAVDVSIADGGDRRGYQQDFRNAREAIREVDLDIAEGADIVMVKPALAYLDVIADVASHVDVPVAAYHVSGEYAMIHAAGERGWIDADAVALEHLTAIKRAGATIILTYFTRWFAEQA
jgi:porphobilinogen synthase